ncbi:hypothetical protein BN14_06036 [Rhizoctonia solani AG-1 IB]|uniref:Uncharacterized protein n=1 Tax=Thanatephorus cucumeris (strain AG1-IB / isolate 7/3/14) TaxID=1108050 RepID=M5BXK6_THACB|nr:hypothetical protein BN14_06036 [Rhizoctonia solani AG-1 IB]
MNTQAWPQVTIPQENFNSNFFDFSFVDPQTQTDSFSASSLSSMWEIPDISGMDLDQLLMSANSSLSEEDIQQIMNSFSASPGMSQALQEAGPAPFEASFQQETIPQIHMPTNNVLPQPPMLVPSQAAVGFQPVLPSPKIPRSAGAGPSSQANSGSSLLTAISLLKLNMRFNPVFQKMGFTSCPDRIDLKAGMEREDAMIAVGYLPQTHIPWEQAIKLLGKQGFRSYYYSEIQRAKEDRE